MPDKRVHALLIEDDPGDQRLIKEFLTRPGGDRFSLTLAGSLSEGMDCLREKALDIVLLDLSLPDSTGLETVQRLRDEFGNVPLVVFTGLDDDVTGTQAVQLGAQDYLIKGDVDSHLLKRALRYAIERFRAEQALRNSQEEYRSLIDDVFNNSASGVAILDASYKVVWVNEALLTYFGMQREDIVGHDKRVLAREKLKRIFSDPDLYECNLLSAYEKQVSADRFECLVTPTSGREERWLEYWSQPIRAGVYANGRIEHYSDITTRKAAELAERDQRILAEALRGAAAILTSTLYLEEVLDRILENLEQVVLYDKADVVLLDEDSVQVARSTWTGQGAKTQPELQSGQPVAISSLPFLALMLSTRSYLLSNNIRQDPCWRDQPEVSTLSSYLGTPISFQNQIVGFISIYSVHFNQYDEVDAERLQIFASHAAIAIQNAQMHKESRHLATLQERQRLARELHDSVSQTLFTSSVMAESALLQWNENAAKARTLLADVLHLTKSALAEMRVLLLELRPKALEQMSLSALIELLAQAVQGRNMIEVVCKFGDIHVLPPAVKVGLYRITQEALNNVIKHSTATRVDISADVRNSTVLLQIRDNGQGFERQQVSGSSLGLGIMKERAEEIHAKLRIDSAPGSGTTIQVVWNAQSL